MASTLLDALEDALRRRLHQPLDLAELGPLSAEEQRAVDAFFRDIASNQHPDGDV